MKYCVMASLQFSTPAQRDNLDNDLMTKIAGRPIWGGINKGMGLSEEGKPQHSLEVRFDEPIDMEDTFSFIKTKMTQIPVLRGRVSKHNCTHDEGSPQPCIVEEEFSK